MGFEEEQQIQDVFEAPTPTFACVAASQDDDGSITTCWYDTASAPQDDNQTAAETLVNKVNLDTQQRLESLASSSALAKKPTGATPTLFTRLQTLSTSVKGFSQSLQKQSEQALQLRQQVEERLDLVQREAQGIVNHIGKIDGMIMEHTDELVHNRQELHHTKMRLARVEEMLQSLLDQRNNPAPALTRGSNNDNSSRLSGRKRGRNGDVMPTNSPSNASINGDSSSSSGGSHGGIAFPLARGGRTLQLLKNKTVQNSAMALMLAWMTGTMEVLFMRQRTARSSRGPVRWSTSTSKSLVRGHADMDYSWDEGISATDKAMTRFNCRTLERPTTDEDLARAMPKSCPSELKEMKALCVGDGIDFDFTPVPVELAHMATESLQQNGIRDPLTSIGPSYNAALALKAQCKDPCDLFAVICSESIMRLQNFFSFRNEQTGVTFDLPSLETVMQSLEMAGIETGYPNPDAHQKNYSIKMFATAKAFYFNQVRPDKGEQFFVVRLEELIPWVMAQAYFTESSGNVTPIVAGLPPFITGMLKYQDAFLHLRPWPRASIRPDVPSLFGDVFGYPTHPDQMGDTLQALAVRQYTLAVSGIDVMNPPALETLLPPMAQQPQPMSPSLDELDGILDGVDMLSVASSSSNKRHSPRGADPE